MATPASTACKRVREQVSLRLDDELSELERRMLDVHLGRCETCRAYAASVVDFTSLMRQAPAVPLTRPVVVSHIRRDVMTRVQVGVAAAFAVAALGLGVQVSWSDSGPERSTGVITRFPTQSELEWELAILGDLPNRDRPASTGLVL
jgi:predicted anti-sigma-YlaC factor YlaD